MAITRDDLARLEGRPDVLGDFFVRRTLPNLGAHLLEPPEDFLVGETGCSACDLTRLDPSGVAHPCRGPARPLSEAAKERNGSERADPTKCPVWAWTSAFGS